MSHASTCSSGPTEATAFLTVRYGLALALSFFPVALLYPLGYPGRELITLGFWILAFPSLLSYLSVALLGMFALMGYDFYGYNVVCVVATLSIALAASKKPIDDLPALLTIARACIVATIFVAAWQATSPALWLSLFPDLQGLDDGRGAGLRTEPSYLAAPLSLYLALLVRRYSAVERRWRLFVEAFPVVSVLLGLTQSLSVLILVLCFLPALTKKLVYAAVPGLVAVGVAAVIFHGRIVSALSDASGDIPSLLTTSIGSWRNIPDIIIIANYENYLFPGNPSDIRDLLNTLVMAWSSEFGWLENTFSLFSASATTLGLVFTAVVFVSGQVVGWRRLPPAANLRLAWTLLYFASWFFVPKFEACSWIALGFLASTPRGSAVE